MLLSIIPSRVHAVLDYLVAAVFILLPWIIGYSNYSYGPWVMMGAGVVIIIYSLMTRYEGGYVGLISMRTHLIFDFALGLFLIVSPFLLNFEHRLYTPHIIGGVFSICAAVLTNPHTTKVHGPQLRADKKARPMDMS